MGWFKGSSTESTSSSTPVTTDKVEMKVTRNERDGIVFWSEKPVTASSDKEDEK